MGTVLSSTVQVSFNSTTRHETPLVLYAYQVDGRTFQGEMARPKANGATHSASATVARYPAGSPVTVYYDPANPANSALEV